MTSLPHIIKLTALLSGILFSAHSQADTLRYNNAVYEGQVGIYNTKKGRIKKPNGQGTLRFNSGNVHKGMFSNGRPHGLGTRFYASGSKCYGRFEGGKMNGYFKCTYSSGARYEGTMQNNKRTIGRMTYSNGNVYDGAWRNGKPHGRGEKRYSSGNRYVGSWKNGKLNGEAVLRYASGASYTGYFRDNKKHGPGEYINTAKRINACLLYNMGDKVRQARSTGSRAECYDKARRW